MNRPDLKAALAEVDQENRERQDRYKALLAIMAGGTPVYGVGALKPKPPGFRPKLIITLSRAESTRQPPGATITACQGCHVGCWITPKGREALSALPEARVLCVECTVAECQKGAPS